MQNDTQHFQLLADEINRLVPSYKTAWANIETIGDVYGANIFYEDHLGEFHYLNQDLDAMMDIFNAMREDLIAAGKPPFSSATFMLNTQGKFSCDYGYADVSDFGRSGERRTVWIKQYLGETVKIFWD
jgi:Protein of unknown function, DUF600